MRTAAKSLESVSGTTATGYDWEDAEIGRGGLITFTARDHADNPLLVPDMKRDKDIADVLEAYIREVDEVRATRLLIQLVCDHAQPMISRVVRSRIGADRRWEDSSREQQDAEDICADVVILLLRRLRAARTTPDTRYLNDFPSYVAVTAYNACNRYLREKYPERYRLKAKLRYMLNREAGFAVWEENDTWVCGFSEWREQGRLAVKRDEISRLRDDRQLFERAAVALTDSSRTDASRLVSLLFEDVGGPVEIDVLVSIVADLGGIQEARVSSNEPYVARDHPAPSELNHATKIEQHLYLRRLWLEICGLPHRQRVALLLNLRDAQGRELMTLLAHLRIAPLAQIAAALEMSNEMLATIWNNLPVDDATISNYLGVTRQQVINLRLSARRRLARRMEGRRSGQR